MSQSDDLKAELESLKKDVERLEAALRRVAGLITRHGIDAPPLTTGDVPLRERMEVLEFRVDSYLRVGPESPSSNTTQFQSQHKRTG